MDKIKKRILFIKQYELKNEAGVYKINETLCIMTRSVRKANEKLEKSK